MEPKERATPIEPVIVYLDNQDYSVLANPNRHIAEPDSPSLLAELRAMKESGAVRFVFSDVGVAEALPMKPADVSLSLNQVKLLRELCGDNALVTYSQLLREELLRLHHHDSTPPQVFGGKYGWLPPGLERQLDRPTSAKTLETQALELLVNQGLDQRSVQTRLPIAVRLIREHHVAARKARIDRGEFYVHPKFHNLLLRAAIGEATEAEKKAAFLESWTDLEWLVGTYSQQPEVVNWLRDSVRKPNASGGQALRRFADAMARQDIPESWRNGGVNATRDGYLIDLVAAVSKVFDLPYKNFFIEDIRTHCPGLFTQAAIYFSFAWAHIASGAKKQILDSTAADAMHSVYAPYVDVFRTDKAMLPHAQRSLADTNTHVVRLRKDLPVTIRQILSARAAKKSG